MLNTLKIWWCFCVVKKFDNDKKNNNLKQKKIFLKNGFSEFAQNIYYKNFPSFEKMKEFQENFKAEKNCMVEMIPITDRQFGMIKMSFTKIIEE
ncbi:MAG: hypothetical protein IKB71_09190 [Lentisphaeria bacterium]|nr:hypothetical protein [Lentisphaeria bacterium]